MRSRSRRRFGILALGTLAFGLDGGTQAAPSAVERRLELTNIHTGEVVSVTFRDADGLTTQQLARLRHVLRDYRRDEEHEIDPALFVLLSDLAREAGCEPHYEVISGYRSPATNAQLHAAGHGVAQHSLHMQGRAMDVRLKRCPLSRLRELALAAKRGGVGYYARSNFVHLDTGAVRAWQE
ncbi:MAG: DUF882 domain-containing protein [Steroidobacteraceae bacterium]